MLRFLAFGTSISLTNLYAYMFCKDIGDFKSPYSPDPAVFSVVWLLLYITTGLAWEFSKEDSMLTCITSLLCLWLICFCCGGEFGLRISVFISAIATILSFHLAFSESAPLVFPLAVWLAFATFLNVTAKHTPGEASKET